MRKAIQELLLVLLGALAGATPALFISQPWPIWALAVVVPLGVLFLLFGLRLPQEAARCWHIATRKGVRISRNRIAWLVGLLFGASGQYLVDRLASQELEGQPIILLKRPVVGILSDLDWDEENEGSTATYTGISPAVWRDLILQEAENHSRRVSVVCTATLEKPLHRFAVLLNPYGGVYPVTWHRAQDTLDVLLGYIRRSGTYVNVGDVPGAWAYVKELKRRQRMVEYSPVANVSSVVKIATPFSEKLGLDFFRPTAGPVEFPLVDTSGETAPVSIAADVFCQAEWDTGTGREEIVSSIPEPSASVNGQAMAPRGMRATPFFLAVYGKGRVLISTPMLRHPSCPEAVQQQAKSIAREAVRSILLEAPH